MTDNSEPKIESLDHFFVYSSNLQKTKQFYSEILGLKDGPRPQFSFPGHWFYLNEKPVVHVGTSEFEGGFKDGESVSTKISQVGTGSVDHIAFKCKNIQEFIARLDSLGQPFRTQEIPDFDLKQIFVKDPNGVTIELNFFGE